MNKVINLKKTGLTFGIATLLAGQVPSGVGASPLVTIGDNADIFFNGGVTARYDDNIFLQNNAKSDYVFIFSPGVELNVGNQVTGNVNLYYREDIYRYDDFSRLDTNQSNIFLEGFMVQPRLSLRVNASYEELIQNTPEIITAQTGENLVERDLYTAGVRGEYEISQKTSVATGVNYSGIRYDTIGYTDSDSISIPVNFYYEVTPKVDLSVGYRFRNTDTKDVRGTNTPRADYRDHNFNVGVRGEILPKLQGEGRVGYQDRSFRGVGSGSRSTMSADIDFSYFATPKLTILTGLFRDFGVAGDATSVTSTGGSLGARYAFNHLVSAQGGLNYVERRWQGINREDDTFDLNVGLNYTPNVYLTLSAGYIFRSNDSTVQVLDFDQNIFSLSASLRY